MEYHSGLGISLVPEGPAQRKGCWSFVYIHWLEYREEDSDVPCGFLLACWNVCPSSFQGRTFL
ncbi:hypothetical protein Pyn_15446 [Prunus yedoensis var. nudiflora]|uniref:Uncharacterized protein n=1 Tax=Prunus yedoensis var. nudiflora TaxID=2094558 RepID=A0A314XJJ5_PRUYE|nr:hypothetical protein Pyn_15446 [Prunus yedoensis var. nudiflora]